MRSACAHCQSASTAQRGATIVEAGLVFPVLLLMLLGFLQYAKLFSADIALRNVLSIGARHALNLDQNDAQTFRSAITLAISNAYTQDSAFSGGALTTNVTCTTQGDGGSTVPVWRIDIEYETPLFFPLVVSGRTGNTRHLSISTEIPRSGGC